ncbi:hypothetical protein EDD86DRAFT_274355 [Gorgonomyces haynaldii]|nr:hypothetical protein EDD86DRAFT_274355 [Gorgonomyces haynaldii]
MQPLIAVLLIPVLAMMKSMTIQKDLHGAGATFPATVYRLWSQLYTSDAGRRGVSLNMTYNLLGTSGSSGGQISILNNVTHYGASDAFISDTNYNNGGGNLIMFPIIVGSIVFPYNLPGYSSTLVLARDTLAGIFSGNITTWSDPLLLRDNPGLSIYSGNPNATITVLVRSDSSGSTEILSSALSQFSSSWTSGIFTTAAGWPSFNNTLVSGTLGMTTAMLRTSYAIGYVEQAYAAQFQLNYAAVKNKAGNIISPTADSLGSAVEDFVSLYGTPYRPNILNYRIQDGSGTNTYPLTAFSYLIIRKNYPTDCLTKYELIRYVYWAMTDSAADTAARNLYFKTLTGSMKSKVFDLISQVNCTDGTNLYSKAVADITAENKKPVCSTYGCVNGDCIADNVCQCNSAYMGNACNILIPNQIVSIDKPVSLGVVAVSALGVVATIASVVVIYFYRKRLRFISPSLTIFICFGAGLVYVGLILGSNAVSPGFCMASDWFMYIGYALMFVFIAAKNFRVFKLLVGAKKFEVAAYLSDTAMIRNSLLLVLPIVLILTLWHAIDTPTMRLVLYTNTSRHWVCLSQPTTMTVVSVFLIAYFTLVLGVCIYLSFQTRFVAEQFNESSYINAAIGSVSVIALISVPVILTNILNPSNGTIFKLYASWLAASTAIGTTVWRWTFDKATLEKMSSTRDSSRSANTQSLMVNGQIPDQPTARVPGQGKTTLMTVKHGVFDVDICKVEILGVWGPGFIILHDSNVCILGKQQPLCRMIPFKSMRTFERGGLSAELRLRIKTAGDGSYDVIFPTKESKAAFIENIAQKKTE